MLLGRVANGLYWMNRYIERAENMARLVDAGLRMALTRTQGAEDEWKSVLLSAGADVGFSAKYAEYTVGAVSDFLIRDTSNPSSSMSSMETARFNARMVRTALNESIWEAWNRQQPADKRQSYDEWAGEKIRRVTPLARWQDAEDIANMAVYLASAAAKNITGQTINVDGGFVMHW